jgi:cAMP phosphodiesterase
MQYASAYLVNDTLAVDCGPLGFWRTPADQARVRHVVLTHAHIDHLASLPILAENAYDPARGGVTVWGSDAVLDALRNHIFNWQIWPNLREIPTKDAPMMRVARLEAETPVTIDGIRITPVPVNHTVPTFGLVLESGATTVVIASDTGPTERLWDVANALPRLDGVYLEATFPNHMRELADVSGHLTPETLGAEVRKLRHAVPVMVVHVKARHRERVAAELAALGLDCVAIAEPGREYVW